MTSDKGRGLRDEAGRGDVHDRGGRRHHVGEGGGRRPRRHGGGPGPGAPPGGHRHRHPSGARSAAGPGGTARGRPSPRCRPPWRVRRPGWWWLPWSPPSPPSTAGVSPGCPASSTATPGPGTPPGTTTRRPVGPTTPVSGEEGARMLAWAAGSCRGRPGYWPAQAVATHALSGVPAIDIGHRHLLRLAAVPVGGGTPRRWPPSGWRSARCPHRRALGAGGHGRRHADGGRRRLDRRLLRADGGRGRPPGRRPGHLRGHLGGVGAGRRSGGRCRG